VPEEYQAESSAKGGSRLICVIPSEGGEIDSTGRSQLKIATVRRGLMSGAGGCRITAARKVRTRQRAGRIKLKGLPGIVTRSRDGTFLISRSWCQCKGSFIEPQCKGQAEFDTHPSHPGVDRRVVCDLPPDAAGRLGTRRPRPSRMLCSSPSFLLLLLELSR